MKKDECIYIIKIADNRKKKMSKRQRALKRHKVQEPKLQLVVRNRKENTEFFTKDPKVVSQFLENLMDNIESIGIREKAGSVDLVINKKYFIEDYEKVKEHSKFLPIRDMIDHHLAVKREKRRKGMVNKLRVAFAAISLFLATGVGIKLHRHSPYERVQEVSSITEEVGEEILLDSLDVVEEAIAIQKEEAQALALEEQIGQEHLVLAAIQEEAEKPPIYTYQEYLPNIGTVSDGLYEQARNRFGNIIDKYAEMMGIDSSIITCIIAQEYGNKTSMRENSHGSIGQMQIQVDQHLGSTKTFYNYKTGQTESFKVTMDLLQSNDGNIKVGTAILQNALAANQGNIFLALQEQNFGCGAIKTVKKRASQRLGKSVNSIESNPYELDWIADVKQYSERRGGYGDKNYISNVLKRYPENELTIVYSAEGNQKIRLQEEKDAPINQFQDEFSKEYIEENLDTYVAGYQEYLGISKTKSR